MNTNCMPWILLLTAGIVPQLVIAQNAPTLKSLAANHGALVAGDVTITNFHTPLEFPSHFIDVIVPYAADNIAVSAHVRPDGNVDVIFTAIDPATSLPSPLFIDAANGQNAPANRLYMVQYDVVVTNPQRALHAVGRSFGPGTTANGATGAFNFGYQYPGLYSGSIAGVGQYISELSAGGVSEINSWTNVPGPAPINSSFGNPPGFADYSGVKLGNEWGLGSGPWGGIRSGTAYLDSMTITLVLAPSIPPPAGSTPGVSGFSASSVFLTSPAGPGGAPIALSAGPGVFNGQSVSVPSLVVVPEGSTYASWPVTKSPGTNAVDVSIITGILNGTEVTAGYQFYPDVYPPAQPQVSIAKLGAGKGTVTSSDRVISCGSKCSGSYLMGRGVLLTAQAASGSVFSGWTSGPCAGSTAAACSFAIADFTTLVTAQFDAPAGGGGGKAAPQFTLSVGRGNAGTVTATPAGKDHALDCGNACSAKFDQGTVVTLTATPPAGKTFATWGGACSGTALSCTVTITQNTSVQANFNK